MCIQPPGLVCVWKIKNILLSSRVETKPASQIDRTISASVSVSDRRAGRTTYMQNSSALFANFLIEPTDQNVL